MSLEVLEEEYEVLESIYPTELTNIASAQAETETYAKKYQRERYKSKLNQRERSMERIHAILKVHYPEDYPDSVPGLSLEPLEGELDDAEIQSLLDDLKVIGEESLGLAMTFTLVSHLREQLLTLIDSRAERRKKEEHETERLRLEVEEAKTRGTPVTAENFAQWNAKYLKDLVLKKAQQEEEKLKSLSPKERDEYKKIFTRLTGRQLFERDRNLATSDASLLEEGTVSVDVSQYDRTQAEEEEEEQEQERVTFSDSD